MRVLPALLTLALLTFSAVSCRSPEKKPPPPPAAAAPPAAPLPSKEELRNLIETSAAFAEYEFTSNAFTFPLKRAMMNEPVKNGVDDLRAAKWVSYDRDEVILSRKAQSDRRWLVRANGFVDIVPLGRKVVKEVSSVRPLPDARAVAGIEWRWKPNEVGEAFKRGPLKVRFDATYAASATLEWTDNAWSVLSIEPVK